MSPFGAIKKKDVLCEMCCDAVCFAAVTKNIKILHLASKHFIFSGPDVWQKQSERMVEKLNGQTGWTDLWFEVWGLRLRPLGKGVIHCDWCNVYI